MHLASIESRVAPCANAAQRVARPRPVVFIVDRPKTVLLIALLAGIALVVAGALVYDLLTPRGLVCEATLVAGLQQ
jgi:hypothetical protein